MNVADLSCIFFPALSTLPFSDKSDGSDHFHISNDFHHSDSFCNSHILEWHGQAYGFVDCH